jgi:hypothetical protein
VRTWNRGTFVMLLFDVLLLSALDAWHCLSGG